MSMLSDALIKIDPWLEPFGEKIDERISLYNQRLDSIISNYGSLKDFSNLHHHLGLIETDDEWILREYAPNATTLFLIGDFNNWNEISDYQFSKIDNGFWELRLTLDKLKHKDLYKLKIYWNQGEGERLPAFVERVIQDQETKIYSAQVWKSDKLIKSKPLKMVGHDTPLFIYECHIGMGTNEERVGTFEEFRTKVLPRIKQLGYNVIQIMALQEHPYYGSFGYHVSNYFALSSRFGTPEEFKELVNAAHVMGIRIVMDIVHSHAVKNLNEGLGCIDGVPGLYFYNNERREHPAWDSLCFDYGKEWVQRFLLSNCRYWIEEYGIDGFRFDGVTSMLYHDHGLGKAYTTYSDYFDGGLDSDAQVYLTLANHLIHEINPYAITIAEEMSGLPGLAANIRDGGIGFDFRMAMGIPDFWIKLIKELEDDKWNVGQIFHELTNHRAEERTITYAESHDQALVGDQTIIFRLIDKDMYWHMHKDDANLIVDRGIALHKLIRLITASTVNGGYLNFMGNEFGHPEWIDFPREGNNWSFSHARRQWNLVDDPNLKYHLLNNFDIDMVQLLASEEQIHHAETNVISCNEGDQILAFQRKDIVFVFNLNPTHSFTDYGINVEPGKYRIILNTDNSKYGGFDHIDESMTYYSIPVAPLSKQHYLNLYLPPRTAIVLKKQKIKSIYDI